MINTAEYLTRIRSFSSKWINVKTCKVYAWIVFCILFLFLAVNSARLFWSFFPDYRGGGNSGRTQTASPKEHSYLADLLDTKVFPVLPEKLSQLSKTAQQVASGHGAGSGVQPSGAKPSQPVGPSKLPLVITGILASDHRNKSQVIIQYRNEEVLYGEGDAIEGTPARVSHIMDNRVEIFNSGRIDVYFLDEDNKVPAAPVVTRNQNPNTTASNAPKTSRPDGKALPQSGGQSVSMSGDFMDYVSISPIKDGSVMKGYRLNPGKKPELFAKAGFRENDVATVVNGYDLREPEQARKLFAEYKNIQNFEVTVERDGVTENIYINMSEMAEAK
ncbi:MAG: type II secretion system protein GspC [Succinivibrionaceae bacterium]|nr:type II secretion system protein GspC [Succinivibrionaceae bacterium]